MKLIKSQRGAIDIILIMIVFVLAAGLGGYVYYNQRQAQKSYDAAGNGATVSKHTSISKSSASQNDYAGWKSYTSTADKFSFQYPADWKLSVAPIHSGGDPKSEDVTIQGPNNFALRYQVWKPTTVTSCQNCIFHALTSLTSTNYGKTLYIVVNSTALNAGTPGLINEQTIGISPYASLQSQPNKDFPQYQAKNLPGYIVAWIGEYGSTEGGQYAPASLSFEDFIKKPEVTTAKLILESMRY